ncbi:MAG: hypothetical protein M0036_07960 [Desulfobacteraceae bacterium]|nr:hypothetical protein [Desulfobacteraceae bacterium]
MMEKISEKEWSEIETKLSQNEEFGPKDYFEIAIDQLPEEPHTQTGDRQ